MARGFEAAGFSVDRMTTTNQTPAKPSGYAVIAVVANTFYASPDWPTRRYLARAEFSGVPVIGVIAGAGSTERAQVQLEAALKHTGARLINVLPLWIMRPNDPAQDGVDNRKVGQELARQFVLESATGIAQEAAPARPIKDLAQRR